MRGLSTLAACALLLGCSRSESPVVAPDKAAPPQPSTDAVPDRPTVVGAFVVEVRGSEVLLDGVKVSGLPEDSGRMSRLDGLFDELRRRRAEQRAAGDGVAANGIVYTAILPEGMTVAQARSVLVTGALAGYPTVQVMVGATAVVIELPVPEPSTSDIDLERREIMWVAFDRSATRVAWVKQSPDVAKPELVRSVRLPERPDVATKMLGGLLAGDWSGAPCDDLIVETSPSADFTQIHRLAHVLSVPRSCPRPLALQVVFPGSKTDAAFSPLVAKSGRLSSGRLAPEVIQELVRGRYGEMRACYEDGLKRNADLKGRITVRLIIGRDGRVSSAKHDPDTFGDAEVAACVLRTFKAIHFPPPQGGIVTVVYPIVFSPEAE